MDIVFMGTPDFAVPILEKLIEHYNVTAVITQPDKPKGRGNRIVFPPVKECAIKHDIPVLQPIKIKDPAFIEELKSYPADIFVVAAYGQILPESVLFMPKFGSVNVHGSLLPKYRGAAPIQWAIIDGESTTGVTIMQMDTGLDTGDMLLKNSFQITPDDTYATVHDKMSKIGADTLIEALKLIQSGKIEKIKQDDKQSTYAKMITKDTGKIQWHKTSESIINLIRGLDPWPGAYALYNGETLKIWKAESVNNNYGGKPGEIMDIIKNKGIIVKTGDGAILVTQIQGSGSKRMSCSDYLRGRLIETGVVLS